MAYRNYGTNTDGRNFNELLKALVWSRAAHCLGNDPRYWRVDPCGAPIYLYDYGDTTSKYGWEIDHILAVALGGGDDPRNLQVLQWSNNRSKGDGPAYGAYCVVNG